MLVILETVLDRQPGHPDINARLGRVALRIEAQDRTVFQHRRIQQNHIDVVVIIFRVRHGRIINRRAAVAEGFGEKRNYFCLLDSRCPTRPFRLLP